MRRRKQLLALSLAAMMVLGGVFSPETILSVRAEGSTVQQETVDEKTAPDVSEQQGTDSTAADAAAQPGTAGAGEGAPADPVTDGAAGIPEQPGTGASADPKSRLRK